MTALTPKSDDLEEEATEFAWLIERGQPERQVPTVWWTGLKDRDAWTTNAFAARRFDSQEAAEQEIARLSGPLPRHRFGRATEHGFIGAPR